MAIAVDNHWIRYPRQNSLVRHYINLVNEFERYVGVQKFLHTSELIAEEDLLIQHYRLHQPHPNHTPKLKESLMPNKIRLTYLKVGKKRKIKLPIKDNGWTLHYIGGNDEK